LNRFIRIGDHGLTRRPGRGSGRVDTLSVLPADLAWDGSSSSRHPRQGCVRDPTSGMVPVRVEDASASRRRRIREVAVKAATRRDSMRRLSG
jgi:hypothetical protein